jgi:hypothetical protein
MGLWNETETLPPDKRFKYNMTQLGGSLVCEYKRTALLSTRVSCNTEKIW